MNPTGSSTTLASRSAACAPFQLDTVSHVNSAVRPRVSTTNRVSVQTVERTERTFVHSALSRLPARVWLPAAGTAGPPAGPPGGSGVIRPPPPPPPPHHPSPPPP